jgi:ABC-type sugar transport system permease subunit
MRYIQHPDYVQWMNDWTVTMFVLAVIDCWAIYTFVLR